MGDNDKDQCALKEQCAINEDRRAKKKYTRTLTCKLCLRDWHAYCSGYHTKSDNELSNIAKIFVCERCHYFTNTVADMVFDKVNTVIQALKSDLSASNLQILDKLRSIEENIAPQNNIEVDVNSESSLTQTENCIISESVPVVSNENTTNNTICRSVNENTATNSANKVDVGKDQILTYYLCGIECELSLDDIKFILEDEGISFENINVEFPKGNFRKKRFIVLTSKSNRRLFAFKRTFDKSSLVGTWFLRSTPPKSNAFLNKITSSDNNRFDSFRVNTNAHHDYAAVKNCSNVTYKAGQNVSNKAFSNKSYNNKTSNDFHKSRNIPPINMYKNTPLTNAPSYNYWQRNTTKAVHNLSSSVSPPTNEDNMVPFLEKLLTLAKKT